jgi:hypothetical protein
MKDMVWIRYEKRVHGHPSEVYFLFPKEDAEDKETAEYYFENEWHEKIIGGENAGFWHDWEIVDHPPVDWMEREAKRAEASVKKALEYSKFMNQELLRVKY